MNRPDAMNRSDAMNRPDAARSEDATRDRPPDPIEAALSSLRPTPPTAATLVAAAFEAGRRAGAEEAASMGRVVTARPTGATATASVPHPPARPASAGRGVNAPGPRPAEAGRASDRTSLWAWRVAAGLLLATSVTLALTRPATPASPRPVAAVPVAPAPAIPTDAPSPPGKTPDAPARPSYLALRAAVLERGLSALDDARVPRPPTRRRPAPPVAGWGADRGDWIDDLAGGAS